MILIALLAEGSILLEDALGVGKTMLAKSFARLIDLDYQRIECTPDLLPGDILDGSIYIVALATATRRDGRRRVGCSPRGCKMLLRAAQASGDSAVASTYFAWSRQLERGIPFLRLLPKKDHPHPLPFMQNGMRQRRNLPN